MKFHLNKSMIILLTERVTLHVPISFLHLLFYGNAGLFRYRQALTYRCITNDESLLVQNIESLLIPHVLDHTSDKWKAFGDSMYSARVIQCLDQERFIVTNTSVNLHLNFQENNNTTLEMCDQQAHHQVNSLTRTHK